MQIGVIKPRVAQSSYMGAYSNKSNPNFSANSSMGISNNDGFVKSLSSEKLMYAQSGKFIQVVSFTGFNPNKVVKPAIQMKVTGVRNFQKNALDSKRLFNIDKLAKAKWRDGDEILFDMFGKDITLKSPIHGEIGRVPDEIKPLLLPLLYKDVRNFKFELSNVIAGNTKGAETIGLRVNLVCDGKNPQVIKESKQVFNEILNNPLAAEKVLQYQPIKTYEDILKEILIQTEKDHGPAAAKQMQKIISNIVREIDDPNNKNILIVGHRLPDWDTTGSVLGLHNIIKLIHKNKKVHCGIDDEITGLIRHKIPGLDAAIKPPYSPSKIELFEQELKKAKDNSAPMEEIAKLEEALAKAKDRGLHLDPKQKYDLVIMLDIPTPKRFSSGFKNYIQDAKKVIYIDHHPFRPEEWEKMSSENGINMKKIQKDGLAWIAERVPAAAQMATIIAAKLSPKKNPLAQPHFNLNLKEKELLNGMAAAFSTGMSTDTGGFTRTANLVPEDIKDALGNVVPIQSRPNFYPEGMAKWLFEKTHYAINKKWLRDEITYDIDDRAIKDLPYTAREKMVEFAENHLSVKTPIGFGFTKASFDQMTEVLNLAKINAPETKFSDVQTSFKYSEIMGDLQSSSMLQRKGATLSEKEIGLYDRDKIAVLISESEKAGIINTEGKKSETNALRFSFRSQDGTNYAERLAMLFNGGGHGSASGGHFVGKNVSLDSRFSVIQDGQKVTNPKEIHSLLKHNQEIMNDGKIPEQNKAGLCKKIELVQDDNGKLPEELMESIVSEIRREEGVPEPLEKRSGKKKQH